GYVSACGVTLRSLAPSAGVRRRALWDRRSSADTVGMGRRVGLLLALLALVVASAASGATTNRSQFASAEIRAVVEAGLMGPSVNAFRPDDPLTASELAVVVSSLGGSMSIPDPDAVVPVRELDARLVSLAGLRPEAQLVRQSALDVGISPRPWLGTETVARLLGFPIN